MDTYYGATAFKLNAQKTFENEKVIVTDKSSDLRMFGDCPYLLGAGTSGHWYSYIKKPKPHGYFVNKKYIRWVKRKHKQLFKAEVGSTSGLFTLIKVAGLCGGWVMGGGLLLLTCYLWYCDPYKGLLQEFLDSGFLWVVGTCFIVSLIGKYGGDYFDDECGLIFDRPSGKVLYLNLKGEITATYDFKDFKGEVDTFINTGGQKELTAFVSSQKHCQSVLLGQGFDDGVIGWSYLVRFMDVSKPLPDLPEHETTRHLDPITKAYDEKTGRDPNYWAKYTAKEFHKLKVQDRKKAAIWIEERKQLLNEKGIEDLDFLNELVNPASSLPD